MKVHCSLELLQYVQLILASSQSGWFSMVFSISNQVLGIQALGSCDAGAAGVALTGVVLAGVALAGVALAGVATRQGVATRCEGLGCSCWRFEI